MYPNRERFVSVGRPVRSAINTRLKTHICFHLSPSFNRFPALFSHLFKPSYPRLVGFRETVGGLHQKRGLEAVGRARFRELLVTEDLLSAMVGTEGRYISIKGVVGKESQIVIQVDASMDLALQEMAKRIFPLCENFLAIYQFVESRSQFKKGLVNHAFAAALRAFLLVGAFIDYQAMVAQLEHQFRLGRLSIQGLWFFCQPMMGPMHALSMVVEKASKNDFMGSKVLNLLQSQAKALAGDNAVRSLLEKMTQCASAAYLGILQRSPDPPESGVLACVRSTDPQCSGACFSSGVLIPVIRSPDPLLGALMGRVRSPESLTQDYDAKFWQQRYSLKDDIPSFLTSVARTILTTGKYLNVMRECGHNVQVPISENSKLTSFGSSHHYLECIKAAYDFSSGELLNLIKEKYDLMGKLRSLKRYLLLDQGDFLVHFMDIARDELAKRPEDISVEKLQSLLDLALRSTAAATDPSHEELTCCVKPIADGNDQAELVSITGLDTFSLGYKGVRSVNTYGTPVSRSSVLCRSMLKFINSLLHYLTFEMAKDIQIRGHNICCTLMVELLKSKYLIKVFDDSDNCGSIRLTNRELKTADLGIKVEYLGMVFTRFKEYIFQKVEKLKSICLQYAAAIQWLIPSVYIPKPDIVDGSFGSKPKSRSRQRFNSLNLAADGSTIADSILKFDEEFNTELQSLRPILSSSSQAEPYLTRLAQCILGSRND
ncbi:hypothetical protein ACLOJK_033802 [Asimina triloba]